jgi:AcrR family transcriptional regulator
MASPRERRKLIASVRSPPARDRLLKAVQALLLERDFESITTSLVLTQAGVARNTLYHHFGSIQELLNTALVMNFSTGAWQILTMVRMALLQSSSATEFQRRFNSIISATQSNERFLLRIERCRLVVYATRDEAFRKALSAEQDNISNEFTKIFTALKNKGWSTGRMTPREAAVFVQALTFGKLIDDLAGRQMKPQEWLRMFTVAIESAIFADATPLLKGKAHKSPSQ